MTDETNKQYYILFYHETYTSNGGNMLVELCNTAVLMSVVQNSSLGHQANYVMIWKHSLFKNQLFYLKEKPETFRLLPLGRTDFFALFIYNEMYFKLLPENRCL